jgi:hypothetical protein
MGTNIKGKGPGNYAMSKSTIRPLIDRALPFCFLYVTSPDGATIFSMYKQRLFG